MFDGKKVRTGGDIDLLGFEKGRILLGGGGGVSTFFCTFFGVLCNKGPQHF